MTMKKSKRSSEDNEEDDDDDDEEEDETDSEKSGTAGGGAGGSGGAGGVGPSPPERSDRGVGDNQVTGGPAIARRPPQSPTAKNPGAGATRTAKKRPLECYVCAYKSETPLRACLDPTKFRVHTITCHSVEDRCFTSVISKGETYEAVVRGCRSGCVGSPETTCCELNRCNNQAFAMPLIQQRAMTEVSKTSKLHPTNVLFFVTILLVLQTVVKVAIV
ncbi:uncharacterized protein LOC113238263 isoform X2 [Hyposmocoma kahamanoa]|uniref:uncharacterized protein LOC113238263 isoform X2 n=1 Tax=Hyposmocoma kahamanoa TaxID=1477025 RepID=UPI000E6D7721|nr:uncharacterized protein LOC113238263 isoform X2 [Hyposmocoma kahamanoa]